MVRGSYIAGTGMLVQRRMMETITNNIVNADTTGYKKETLTAQSFDEVLLNRINDNGNNNGAIGSLRYGTQVDQLYIDYTTGAFEETGRSTDLALVGDNAFFAVETPAGERYTRAGAFYLDNEGYLTDGEGNYVLGDNGRIYLGTSDFGVDTNGNITANGAYVDTLRVVTFEDTAALRKQGSNLFYTDEAPANAENYEVRQGFLEGSNVDVAREMVDMLAVYRLYEANQKIVTMTDEITGKAVNEIGSIR